MTHQFTASPTPELNWRWRAGCALLLTLTALLVLFPDGRLALSIDSSPEALGHSDADGDTEQLIIAGFGRERLNVPAIRELAELERLVSRHAGVSQIRSIASVGLPLTQGDEIVTSSLKDRLAQNPSPGEANGLISLALSDPLTRGRLTSKNGWDASILVRIKAADHNLRTQVAKAIEQTVRTFPATQFDFHLTGTPLVTAEIGELILQQLSLVLPTAILIFALIILLAFRSLIAVGAMLLSICCALLWTMAVAVMLGWSLNLVTIVIPPLILTLGVSYGMHVVAAHADTGHPATGLRIIRWPLACSALTTAVGMAALGFNPLAAVGQFAALGTIGTLAAALAAWIVLPLLLNLAHQPPSLWPPVHSILLRGANRVVAYVVRHSRRFLRGGVVLLLICLAGASLVEPGARYVSDLPEDQPTRVAFERISAAFGGASRFHIELHGAADDVMLAPPVLRAAADLQTWLHAQPEVGDSLGLPDYVKRLNQSFGSGKPSDYRIPDDVRLIKQLIFFGAPDEIYDYTNLAFSQMRIEVRTAETDTPVLRELFARLEQRLQDLPPGLSFRMGGEAVAFTQVIEDLAGGQLRSLGAAALVIFLLLSVLFASMRVGLMAMLPNALPVVAYFALLGFGGMPLSPTTALVACIVLGIAVDDSLHLLVRFNQLARERASEEEASRAAVAEVLRPITLTTVATALGFLTLVTSPFHSQATFGLLAAITLTLAWLCDLLLVPAVSAQSSIVTLWDHLRLDLGGNPRATIPVLADMSERQARQFALNASIREVKADQNLIMQGEQSAELFVILEGRLRIWQRDADGSARILAERGRGDSLGEVGYFAAKRSAFATAMVDSRVLVLDPDVLERLRLRHPRVAALAYRNLNRIQAERTLLNM